MLNPNIILAGQQPDIVGSLARGQQAGAQMNDISRQNALNSTLQQHGAGIVAGEANALNALAQFDPQAALGVQSARLGMDQTRQGMAHADQKMAMLSREEQRAIQDQAARMSAQERAAEAARIEQGVAQALQAQTPEQWDAVVGQYDPALVGQFQNREMIAGRYMSVADSLKRVDERNAPADADMPAAIQALQFRAAEAGLEPGTPEYMTFMAEGGRKNDGMIVESTPGGGFRLVQGSAVGGEGRMSPSDPAAMIATIDGILNDEALDTSTGVLSVLQNVPGTPQRRFASRARQLEGQAFLQAFESLKGAGQITEIEGLKATQAIGRLDTAQSADDYREALTELRDVLTAAQGRPAGWAQSQGSAQPERPVVGNTEVPDFGAMSDEELDAWIAQNG